ncbi:metallophosphoesterase [Leptolyngbya sp. FACHB-36]|uniref:metallophosphoesterase n=1 Tax=Leptolyngbya sp. FACHB-36 TaxID=2692808 RepID=UPI0018F007A6
MASPQLLTDPFLQLPTESSVRVVWFTEFAGVRHTVAYGPDLKQTAVATTMRLSRTREDADSKLPTPAPKLIDRPIWRHEADVTGLPRDRRLPYRVTSVREDRASVSSATFSLAAAPSPGKPLKILLTSDHQLKPLAAANIQKAVETIAPIDAVLFAGDLVNVPDRASEWFDCCSGGAFFPVLQGRASYELEKNGVKTRYRGGAVLQHAPMYTAIGNHEVMGRFSSKTGLNAQFSDAFPRHAAAAQHRRSSDAKSIDWIKNNSFNTDTYEEIFSLPQSPQGGKRYYATTFGDMRLVVLYATNIWRVPSLGADSRGKYREREQDFNKPENWGWGQFIFEAIDRHSAQYAWLKQELNSPEFKRARYKVVMLHHPPHSLGENSVPAYADPVQVIDRDPSGKITAIRYEYPRQADVLIRDVVPLLESAGVQLVFYGHSHLWNRFVSPSGMHFLETSNVGNSYGAYVRDTQRNVPTNYKETYAATGDPHGAEPVMPTIAPLRDANNQPMPYIANNDITVFSVFDTATGTISSYRFDTRSPRSAVVKFDEFTLKR